MGHSRCGLGRAARLEAGLGDEIAATAAGAASPAAATLAGILLALTPFASTTATARPAHDQPLYKDPNASVEQRVDDLLSRMTLEEKIAQITCIWNRKQEILTPSGDFDAAKAKQVFPAGIGQVARPSDIRGSGSPYDHPFRNARETVTLVNAIQHYAMKEPRLGIPVLFHEEGLHGYVARDATSFP
jgi:beta-glucosidase